MKNTPDNWSQSHLLRQVHKEGAQMLGGPGLENENVDNECQEHFSLTTSLVGPFVPSYANMKQKRLAGQRSDERVNLPV